MPLKFEIKTYVKQIYKESQIVNNLGFSRIIQLSSGGV